MKFIWRKKEIDSRTEAVESRFLHETRSDVSSWVVAKARLSIFTPVQRRKARKREEREKEKEKGKEERFMREYGFAHVAYSKTPE